MLWGNVPRDLAVTRMKESPSGLTERWRKICSEQGSMRWFWTEWQLKILFIPFPPSLDSSPSLCAGLWVFIGKFCWRKSQKGTLSECFSWKRPQKLSCSPFLILPIKGLRLNRGINLSKVSDWLVSGPGQEARFFNSRPVFFPLYEDFPSHFSLLIYFYFKQQNPVFSK